GDDFVTRLALDDLATRLITVTRDFESALIMAPDARELPVMGRSANGAFNFDRAATVVASEGAALVDPETLALPRTDYDLIVSIFDLTVVNDVVGFLARLRRHLRPDGLFMAVALGGGLWAGGQQNSDAQGGKPWVHRVDIGPRAALTVPVENGSLALALDWRQRIDGAARPSSGAAFTLSAGF
ncbi:MAG: class I SAM-dependent methyltransferase, partial [Blastomonas sp.]|nr:class I SAM-dependent methyltransferase [Blastomonas sp.]